MTPLLVDAEAFLRACGPSTLHFPEGGAQNRSAMWWRREVTVAGATWHLCHFEARRSCPAVVDDFGSLVCVTPG